MIGGKRTFHQQEAFFENEQNAPFALREESSYHIDGLGNVRYADPRLGAARVDLKEPMKPRETMLLIAACIVVFLAVNTIHFQFLPVHVVLYDALLDAAIAVLILCLAIAVYFRRRLSLSPLEQTLSLTVAGLLCAMYAVMGPAIIDRSLSIYILEKLEQRGGGIKYDAMPRVFIDEYIPEHHLTDIRITEQLDSGTIGLKDGCVYLTPRGRLVVAFTRFYRMNILPKHREIMGKYTDALTDPFRNSLKDVPYRCTPPVQ